MKTNRLLAAAFVALYGTVGFAVEKPDAPVFDPGTGSPKVGSAPDRASGVKSDDRASFTVYGTWNALRAVTALTGQFESNWRSHRIHYMPFDSDQIMGKLDRHQCDVGILFDSFVPSANRKTNGQYERFPLARFVIAVAVNARNPLRAMSVPDLQMAFAFNPILVSTPSDGVGGGISGAPQWDMNKEPLIKSLTPWKEISGAYTDMLIEMYRPKKFGPEGWFFQKRILSGGPFADEFSDESIALHEKKSDAEIIAAIAKQANAVGFFRCPFDKIDEKRIRIVGIAKEKDSPPVVPSPAALADGPGDYPLADTLMLYLRPDAPPQAREFCKFAAGPDGAKVLKGYEFWPELELNALRGQQRLADLKAGKGAAVSVAGAAGDEALVKDLAMDYALAEQAVQVKFSAQRATGSGQRALGGGQEKAEIRIGVAGQGLGAGDEAPLRGDAKDGGRSFVFGRRAVGVVANPKTHLTSLMLDELRQIRDGKIKNWPGTNDQGPAIHIYGVRGAENVGALRGEKASETIGIRFAKDSQQVVLAVARDPAAIGFVDLSEMPADDKSVVMLGISGKAALTPALSQVEREKNKVVTPAAGNVPDDYPLQEPVTMYVAADAGPAAVRFAEWVAGHPDAETLAQHHLIPAAGAKVEGGETFGRDGGTVGDRPQQRGTAEEGPHPGPLPEGEGERGHQADATPEGEGEQNGAGHDRTELVPLPDEPPMANGGPASDPHAKAVTAVAGGKDKAVAMAKPGKLVARDPATSPQAITPGEEETADDSSGMVIWGVGGLAAIAVAGIAIGATFKRSKRRRPARGTAGSSYPDTGSTLLTTGWPLAADPSELPVAKLAGPLPQGEGERGFDAYHRWLSIPPEEQPPNDYRLLGLTLFEADTEVIANAADARMAHLRTFQIGKHAALSQQLLNEISAAKLRLLKPASKLTYDQRLKRQLHSPSARA